jgi:hypothetical protein
VVSLKEKVALSDLQGEFTSIANAAGARALSGGALAF